MRISSYIYSEECAAHYTYDIEGNVATILNDNPHESKVAQRYKRTDYYYDLVSGKVNEIIYQHDSADQFMQIYDYDADNRIIGVLTSHDSVYFENDATYEYYDHGPLAREVIGQISVQGIDYAYTLNGWLKGENSSILNPSYDMGHDGDVHGPNSITGRDALGFTLEYFNGDYRAIGSSQFEAYGLPDTSLYNGNIAGATYSIKPLTPKTIGYKYTYDQLNRLNDLVAFTAIDTVNDKWSSPSSILDFQERLNYDENGNIFKYVRHGNTIAGKPLAMDSMNYFYNKGTNQLNHVTDGVSSGNYPNDIDNEGNNNYKYNKIGQLAKDTAGGIDSITWTIYSKIKKVQKYNGDSLVYEYDPIGNRIEKRYYPHSGIADTTLYIRDAEGNILATYDRKKDTVRLSEWDMYGGKRIGSVDTMMRVFPKVPSTSGGSIDSSTVAYLENQKQYELDNHLGNVMVTVSDKKIPVDTTGTPNIASYYLPNIVSANSYSSYGALTYGMSYQISKDSSYRFGFNAMEKDNEIYGAGNAYTTEFREVDPRLGGRWMTPDPIVKPWESPYAGFADNPIYFKDPFGLDPAPPGDDDKNKPANGGTLPTVNVVAPKPAPIKGPPPPSLIIPQSTLQVRGVSLPTPPATQSGGFGRALGNFFRGVGKFFSGLAHAIGGFFHPTGGSTLTSDDAHTTNPVMARKGSPSNYIDVTLIQSINPGAGAGNLQPGVDNIPDAFQAISDVWNTIHPAKESPLSAPNTQTIQTQQSNIPLEFLVPDGKGGYNFYQIYPLDNGQPALDTMASLTSEEAKGLSKLQNIPFLNTVPTGIPIVPIVQTK
jgi:hypothetical protein